MKGFKKANEYYLKNGIETTSLEFKINIEMLHNIYILLLFGYFMSLIIYIFESIIFVNFVVASR